MDKAEKEALKRAVYDIVKRIPRGRATSYSAIAKAIGYPRHSRLVGHMMSECDSTRHKIPAHRVVNSQGILSAKQAFGTPAKMQELLESEGICVHNDRIRHWKSVFWVPLEEI